MNTFCYTGKDLGLTYDLAASTFKVWAPTAVKVTLVLFETEGKYNEEGYVLDNSDGVEYEMKSTDGIWEATVDGDLDGKFYLYKVELENETNYKPDPYSIAVTANGQRSAIVDLKKTNPENWDKFKHHKSLEGTKNIIMELHVRDFSKDEKQNFKYPGKYLAFTEKGLKTKNGTPIGIDSLKELGITHVQLQPVYDYACLNELGEETPGFTGRRFNWGYDPANYNVPEGSYATNPHDPYGRIREFKQMIAALHEQNIGVIMDVVYNHTYSINKGPFQKIVPDYFYRKKEDGTFASGSGCGNEIATERPMVRKYILDSLKYWVNEYGIDGFRFDLMGLIDSDFMETAAKELRAECKEDIILYGEPWQAGGSVLPEEKQSLKGSQKNRGFGVFNDNIRTAIKGSTSDEEAAFMAGVEGFEEDIAEGVCGSINTFVGKPEESINYITVHDDLNLWDKVIYSYGLKKEMGFLDYENPFEPTEENWEKFVAASTPHKDVVEGKEFENDVVRSCLLGNGIVFTSQGVPLFHAGDEFLRSKFGDHNSYRSPDCVNKILWDQKDQYHNVFKYYQGLIQLRKAHPAFCMNDAKQIKKHLEVFTKEDLVVGFTISNHANEDEWKEILVIYNADKKAREVELPKDAEWNVVVDDTHAGCEVVKKVSGDTITVDRISMIVAYTK